MHPNSTFHSAYSSLDHVTASSKQNQGNFANTSIPVIRKTPTKIAGAKKDVTMKKKLIQNMAPEVRALDNRQFL